MPIQLGSAFAKAELDSSGLIRGINDAKTGLLGFQDLALKVGGALKNVGQTMTIGLTLPIIGIGTAAIKMSSDLEETKNKALVVFGEMSDGVIKNAESAATALGTSKRAYLDYASTIGAALTAGGMSIVDATKLSEQAVKHFADLASFHNTQIEDAAKAWESAIRGQFEPIQKYFPFITNQFLITYGTANNLIDENTDELTANERAIILNAIALDEKLNPAMNDFSETSDGLANSTRIAKAEMENALGMLGDNLRPIVTDAVHILNDLLEAFNKLPEGAQKAIIGFGIFLAVAGPFLSFISTIITVVSGISGAITMIGGLGIPFAAVGAAIGTVITAIAGVVGTVLAVLGPILLIIGAVALLYWAFKTNFMGITTAVKQLWFIIVWGFKKMWGDLISGIQEALVNIKEAWDGWIEDNKTKFESWRTWIQTAWQRVLDFFARIRDYIIRVFQNVDWRSIGASMINGLIGGLLGGIPQLVAAAVKAAQAVVSSFDKELDMHSPSRVLEKRGLWTALGYMRGMNRGMDASAIANILARPLLQSSAITTSQQQINLNFPYGLTIKQATELIADSEDRILNSIKDALTW